MNPPDLRVVRAQALLKQCEDLASLSIPATTPHRDLVLKSAGFAEALTAIMDIAQSEEIDPIRAFCIIMVQRGLEAGLDYTKTFNLIAVAFQRAATAHADNVMSAASEEKPS